MKWEVGPKKWWNIGLAGGGLSKLVGGWPPKQVGGERLAPLCSCGIHQASWGICVAVSSQFKLLSYPISRSKSILSHILHSILLNRMRILPTLSTHYISEHKPDLRWASSNEGEL